MKVEVQSMVVMMDLILGGSPTATDAFGQSLGRFLSQRPGGKTHPLGVVGPC